MAETPLCYVCGLGCGEDRRLHCCWGVECCRAIEAEYALLGQPDAAGPSLLLSSGPVATKHRQNAYRCPGSRHFHQSCLQTQQEGRKRDEGLTKYVGVLNQRPGVSPTLRDLRHHLCNECLLDWKGELAVHNSGKGGKSLLLCMRSCRSSPYLCWKALHVQLSRSLQMKAWSACTEGGATRKPLRRGSR